MEGEGKDDEREGKDDEGEGKDDEGERNVIFRFSCFTLKRETKL